MIKENFLGVILAVLFLCGTAYAQDSTDQNAVQPQDQGGETQHEHHHGPSKAAIDACSGKTEDDACQFTTPHGKDISGTCSNAKDGQTLFCKRPKKAPSSS